MTTSPRSEDSHKAARRKSKRTDHAGDQISVSIGDGAANIAAGKQVTQIIGFTAEQVSVLIAQVRTADQPATWDGRRPYMGLAAFQEADAEFFFGREKLVDELLTRVHEARFLCVAGPSGSGKSSLVQAGLLYTLRSGGLDGSGKWVYAGMAPHGDPIEQLALAMARATGKPDASDYLRTRGAVDPSSLNQQAETLLGHDPAQRFVLYIDQFEELFTQTHDEQRRQAFLALITDAVALPDGRVTVILSMRSDFLSHSATYPDLTALINQQFQLVGAMTAEELALAIIKPALAVGVQIEPVLAAQVIDDMGSEPGSLPLMEFALKDLFEAQKPSKGEAVKLTLHEYLERGGIQQALERHADAVFAKLDAGQQTLARLVFSHLVEVGRGTADTRRTASFVELATDDSQLGNIEPVVKALADARLVTTATAADGQRTLTLAHEKLIDAWPWLKRLVNENREAIALQNNLAQDATEWERSSRDSSYLYAGARLATVREQQAEGKVTLAGLSGAFVDAAVAQEDREKAEEEAVRQRQLAQAKALADEQQHRAQEQAQAALRLRKRNRILAAALFGALALAGVAIYLSGLASTRATEAANAKATAVAAAMDAINAKATAVAVATQAAAAARRSKAGELAANAQVELDAGSGPDLPLLLASQAVTATWRIDHYVTPYADRQLLAAMAAAESFGWRMTLPPHHHTGPVSSAAYSPDGKTIVTASADKTARLWDAATGKELRQLQGHTAGVTSAAYSPDGKTIVTASGDQTARLWDAATGKELRQLQGHTDWVYSAAYSPDGKTIVTASLDKTARVWDAATGKELRQLQGHTAGVSSAAYSPDGKTIVTASDDHTARLWDAATGKGLRQLQGHTRPVSSAAYSPDGKTIVTASWDTTARLWDGATGKELRQLQGHIDPVSSAAYSPDGKTIVTASDDQTARLWDAAIEDTLAKATALIQRDPPIFTNEERQRFGLDQ